MKIFIISDNAKLNSSYGLTIQTICEHINPEGIEIVKINFQNATKNINQFANGLIIFPAVDEDDKLIEFRKLLPQNENTICVTHVGPEEKRKYGLLLPDGKSLGEADTFTEIINFYSDIRPSVTDSKDNIRAGKYKS